MADFYVYETHLGAAINKMQQYAKVLGFRDCYLLEASPLDSKISYRVPADAEHLGENICVGRSLESFPTEPGAAPFILPTGIVRSASDGILELESGVEHFEVAGPDERGFYSLTLVLSAQSVRYIYHHLASLMPEIDRFSLITKYCPEFTRKREVWVSHELSDKRKILSFIRANAPDTIENGFVELQLQMNRGETCLLLDTHKLVRVTTRDKRLLMLMQKSVEHFGLKEMPEIHTPWIMHEHCHYRPGNSLDEHNFKNHLKQAGFVQEKLSAPVPVPFLNRMFPSLGLLR